MQCGKRRCNWNPLGLSILVALGLWSVPFTGASQLCCPSQVRQNGYRGLELGNFPFPKLNKALVKSFLGWSFLCVQNALSLVLNVIFPSLCQKHETLELHFKILADLQDVKLIKSQGPQTEAPGVYNPQNQSILSLINFLKRENVKKICLHRTHFK